MASSKLAWRTRCTLRELLVAGSRDPQQGSASDADLSAALVPFWTLEAVTQQSVVDELVHRGWVDRIQPARLGPTTAGLSAHADVFARVERTRAQVISGFTVDEYRGVVEALSRMCANVEATLASSPPDENRSPT